MSVLAFDTPPLYVCARHSHKLALRLRRHNRPDPELPAHHRAPVRLDMTLPPRSTALWPTTTRAAPKNKDFVDGIAQLRTT